MYRKRPFYKRRIKREINFSFFKKFKIKNFVELNYKVGIVMCIRSFFNNENVIKRRITKKRKLKTRKP
jgi:hypothetical protein